MATSIMSGEADLLSLGKHCSVECCRQLDFLPFECAHCKAIFCLEHRTPDGHQCSRVKEKDIQVPVCPLCNQMVRRSRQEDINTQVERHIMSGCTDLVLKKPKKNNKCSLKSCHQHGPVPFICSQCNRNFCVKHRHTQDHLCSASLPQMVACH